MLHPDTLTSADFFSQLALHSVRMMLICNGGGFLLWFLLGCCSGIMPSHLLAVSGGSDDNTPTNSSTSDNKKFHGPNPFTECAMPWSCCDQDPGILPHEILKCGVNKTLSVLNSFCATIDEENDILEAGHCFYNFYTLSRSELVYSDLPKYISEFMCEDLHRTGTLCGKCQDGYYPLAYSYDMKCVQCPNGKSNWWKFVLAAFLPLTIFYIIILFFKVNVVSSHFQGFLFYSQAVSLPTLIRTLILMVQKYSRTKTNIADIAIRCLTTFYGIWNLDFFRSINFGICLGTDTLQTLILDMIVGAYPLLLMVVSYVLIELYDRNFRPLVIMWKPFHRLFSLFQENWDLRTSLVDAFVTAFLLTNVKFQSVSFDLLAPVKVYHLNATGNWTYSIRLFYDATVPYFGLRHLPYAIIALMMVMLFAILPVLLLVLYPFCCFQKLLNLFPFRWYILHTFVDSFYGSYKDGTQPGTRDCRWFASLFILSRFCTILIGAFVKDSMYFNFSAIMLTVVALLFFAVQPFKENVRHFTTINTFFVLLLAMWYTSLVAVVAMQSRTKGLSLFYLLPVISAILPLLYISAIVLHWVYYNRRKFGADLMTKLRVCRSGYRQIL